jgi:hypothetical protein
VTTFHHRLQGQWTMNEPPQAKVLIATLAECTSTRGSTSRRGWAGASSLIGFRGEGDEQGRPTSQLFLVEWQAREGPLGPPHSGRRSVAVPLARSAPHPRPV